MTKHVQPWCVPKIETCRTWSKWWLWLGCLWLLPLLGIQQELPAEILKAPGGCFFMKKGEKNLKDIPYAAYANSRSLPAGIIIIGEPSSKRNTNDTAMQSKEALVGTQHTLPSRARYSGTRIGISLVWKHAESKGKAQKQFKKSKLRRKEATSAHPPLKEK